MASFTDAIPQFNPYIQQLPVEAMVAVGMEKQQRYDQGIQRIQSQIDQVAGLSIARPQDKQYLQSKLNDLGSKLKTVAAADFSNYQLVNSVAGMASSVAKDPNVISAVQSTAQRRAVQEKIQKDTDAGKYNPANNYLFNLTDQEWFNDPTVGASYSGYYTTPIDVWGKIKDIAKEVGIDEKTAQNLFKTDEQGRYLRDKNGDPIINNVMVEETLKGKDASKILNAFKNALTPADYEQLSIEGRYNFRDVTPEQLGVIATSSADRNIKFNNGKIEFLKISLAEQQNKAKTKEYDEKLIKSLSDEIGYFEGLNRELEESKTESLAAVARNPEAVKGMIYRDNYLSSMSETLSSKQISRKYSVNPWFTVGMEINRFEQAQRQWNADYALRVAADKREQKEYDMKMKTLQDQAAYFQSGGVDTPINADPAMVRAIVEGGYSESVTQYNTITNRLAMEALRMANPGDSEEELKKKLYEAAAYRGKTVNPNSGEINTTAQIMASAIQTMYRTNPDSVPKPLHGLIAEADNILKSIESQKSVMTKSQQDAREAASLQGVDMEAYDKVVRDIKPTSVTVNGQSVNLSQQDIIDFINLNPQMYNIFGNLTVDKDQEMLRNQAQIRLGAKFGSGLEDLKSVLYPMQYQPFSERKRAAPSQFLQGIADNLGDAKSQDYNRFLSEAYQKNGAVPMGKTVTVDKGDQKTEDYRNKFLAVLSKYELDLDEDVYNNLSGSVLSDSFGATISTMPGANLQSPSTYTLKITGKDGSSEMIEIERNDYRFLTGYEPPVNPNVKNAFDLLNARGTTNLNKSGEYSTAYFKAQDFSNFSSDNYSLMGDLEEDALNPNIVYPRIYIFDKNTNTYTGKSFLIGDVALPKQINGQINPQLEAFSSGVTTQLIKETTNFPIY
jgi:hypothetical protein